MPQRVFDELKNWALGVNTSASADQLPAGASPRGRNSNIQQLGDDTAVIGKRRGITTFNATPVTGSPRLWGFQFKKNNGTKVNLLVSDTGRLDQLNTNGTTSTLDATAFTAGDHPPVFAVANDLCFIVNDVDQKKFNGTTVQRFGIVRPAAPSASAVAGGTMNAGDWDVAITHFNSNTGHESSLSDWTTVSVTGTQKINVSWSAPTDPQVTHVRVYLRRQLSGKNGYLVVAGATPAPDSTFFGFTPSTLSTALDVTLAQYAAFITLAPTSVENEPPLAGLRGPCWHASRLFLFDSGNLYFSKVKDNTPFPEAFDPNNKEPVNPDDGDVIIATKSYKGKLYIFKRFALYVLTGTDPNSWQVDLVAQNFGTASAQSIVEANGDLYWWTSSKLGLAAFNGEGSPVALGQKYLASTVNATSLNHNQLRLVCGAVDEENSTVLMAVPEAGATRNTRIIPFNYQRRVFPAEWWNPLDVNSMWVVEEADNTWRVYLGGYAGQTFTWWTADNDGVPGGTAAGTVESATSTTLVDSTASFHTSGGKLVDRFVYVLTSDRASVQRRRITDNTGTQLTVTPPWDVTPNNTYSYFVGAIDFQFDTPWILTPTEFLKKKFEFLFLKASTTAADASVDVDLFVSNNVTNPKRTVTISLVGSGGVYDDPSSVYDVTTFGGSTSSLNKKRMACTGFSWRARVRNTRNDEDVLLSTLAISGVVLGIKR